MNYYIDENSKLYEKDGVDLRIENGTMSIDGLRVATDDEVELIINPTPSNSELFTVEFNTLKAEHESEINQLNLAFASAALVDGATQESKQAEIRAAYQLAVSENQASVSALMVKYYG